MLLQRVWISLVALAVLAALTGGCGDDSPKAPSLSGPRPDTLTVETIGKSVQGREIQAVSLGTGQAVVLVIGGIHGGDEKPAADLAEQLARYVGQHVKDVPPVVRVIFIPRANPDGYINLTRTNANDVDLNRNWPTADWSSEALHGDEVVSGGPAPLSEPETSALHDYIDAVEPVAVISLHNYAAIVEPNESGQAMYLGALYAKATGYKLIEEWPYYEITGELIEALNDLQTPAFDVELREGASDTFEKNLGGLKAVLKAVAQVAPQVSTN
jgi:protein MpaA